MTDYRSELTAYVLSRLHSTGGPADRCSVTVTGGEDEIEVHGFLNLPQLVDEILTNAGALESTPLARSSIPCETCGGRGSTGWDTSDACSDCLGTGERQQPGLMLTPAQVDAAHAVFAYALRNLTKELAALGFTTRAEVDE